MVNFAGEVAQRKFSPRSVFPNGASDDLYETVDNLSRFYDPQTVETRMRALEIQTRELVHSPTIWSKIVAVATTLHQRRQMSRREVEHVIRSTVALIPNDHRS